MQKLIQRDKSENKIKLIIKKILKCKLRGGLTSEKEGLQFKENTFNKSKQNID